MEINRIFACGAILLMLLILLPINNGNCQDYIEYNVQLSTNGSAGWLITVVSDVNAPIDNWESFQTRIYDLVDSASDLTGRQMDIDEYSIQINTTISSASKITEYMFIWRNFSIIQNSELVFGDIFGVGIFFGQLYGDSSLQIEYPQNCVAISVNPEPNFRDDSAHILRWYRTQDLNSHHVSGILKIQSIGAGLNLFSEQYFVLGATVIAFVSVLLIVLMVSKRKKAGTKNPNKDTAIASVQFESEEDKILNVLRGAGNSMRQSDITEKCRFSKAKTSQLLASLEKREIIRRYKKGRDKIVTLNESGQGE